MAFTQESAQEMYASLQCAAELIKVARQYFPKSVSNSDRFMLENTAAAVGKAIYNAGQSWSRSYGNDEGK